MFNEKATPYETDAWILENEKIFKVIACPE